MMLDDVMAEIRRLNELMPPPDQQLASIQLFNPDVLVTDLGIEYRVNRGGQFGSGAISSLAQVPVHRNLALPHNVIRFIYADGHHEDRDIRT